MKTVPLERIIEAVEMADDNSLLFLDIETLDTVFIGDEIIDGENYEEIEALIENNRDRFLKLPTKYDIHEYSIMEDFIYSLESGEANNQLAGAIKGKGAFRRFKDTVLRYGLEKQWYAFRDSAYRDIAIRWCKDYDLMYTENGGAPITLHILNEDFTVCKVTDYSKVDFSRPFCFVGKTDEENSLVCETEYVPDNTTEREDGWKAFRIVGTLDFALVGILSKISAILAKKNIGIFAISTYNTDYVLTKEKDYDDALEALSQSGYEIL